MKCCLERAGGRARVGEISGSGGPAQERHRAAQLCLAPVQPRAASRVCTFLLQPSAQGRQSPAALLSAIYSQNSKTINSWETILKRQNGIGCF